MMGQSDISRDECPIPIALKISTEAGPSQEQQERVNLAAS